MKTQLFLILLSSSFWGHLPVRGELLSYEGFDYAGSTTDLLGLNGGTGWNGGWQNINGSGGSINPGNLSADTMAPSGFDSRSAGSSAFINTFNRSGRWLDCSATGNFATHGYLDANGHIGTDGKTLYVSFLQQPNTTIKFYEFEFHRGNLGDPGRIGGLGNDFNFTTVNFRAPNSTQTPIGPGSTNISFYILRIDFKNGGDGVYIYRNPTESLETDNEPVLTLPAAADLSFDGISLAAFDNGVTVKHDEIRLGETWSDVLGGPPAFVLQPASQSGYAGQTVLFTSQAKSKLAVNYQWYRGKHFLSGQTNSNLSLPNVQPTDSDNYWVSASNSLGSATSSIVGLDVQLIRVSFPTQSLTVGPGSNLVISASVAGTQPIAFQWYKNGAALSGETNSTFLRTTGNLFDAGEYSLVASNSHGCITSATLTVRANIGGLLVYEGFDYPSGNGNLPGLNGGIGWAGPWSAVDGSSASVVAPSLTAGTNAPVSYDSHMAGQALYQPNATRSGRALDCSANGVLSSLGLIDSNGNLGADNHSVYISFLQRPDGTSKFYEFELHRADLGDPGRIAGIGNDTDTANVNFRAPDGTQNSLGAGSTNVNFYVVRIDFKPGKDDVYIYRNPGGRTESLAIPTLVMLNVGDLSFNGISFGAFVNNRTVKHDEIRLGMTWADVVGDSISFLQMAGRAGGTSRLRLIGSPNYAYELEAAPSLAGPWTNVARLIAPTIGTGEFIETNALDSRRFYRAAVEPSLPVAESAEHLVSEFEGASYGGWIATGTAFGTAPSSGALPNQSTVSGFVGSGLVNSFAGGDSSIGTLTSPPFTLAAHYLNFLIGGGNHPGKTCLNLLVDGAVVFSATGSNSETLRSAQWDVSPYLGKQTVLQIVDQATGSWGHLLVDQIAMTDIAFPQLSRQMVVTNSLLNLPVKNGSTLRRVSVTVDGTTVRDFDIELADATPDWWATTDLTPFLGKTAALKVNSLPSGSTALDSIVQGNAILGATNLYREPLRPQLHFSAQRGWLNDANGLVYYQGLYHLYFQHNPYGWNWGNMQWGHAVSPDLVHWTQLPVAIYPHSYGDMVYSGSAIIDRVNTGEFKTGTNDVLVAAYTSTGRGECMAYSNDRGQTFTDYSSNPVVVHTGRDPHLLWYAPSNYWVMAVYDETGGQGINFYSSPNLRQWTYRSRIPGFFECPDLFQLPIDGQTNAMKWVLNDASGGYMLGQFDGATFTPGTAKLAGNKGAGFYASQTCTEMPDGDARKIRVAWAQISMPGMPFNQMMYFPTELTLHTGPAGVQLCTQPVAEITNLWANDYSWTNLSVTPGDNPLKGIRGSLFHLRAQFVASGAQEIDFTFQNQAIKYSPATQTITLNGTSAPLPSINGVVRLELIVDRNSIEIFGNNGQLYMPMPASNPVSTSLLSLTCSGGSAQFNFLSVCKLSSAWPQL